MAATKRIYKVQTGQAQPVPERKRRKERPGDVVNRKSAIYEEVMRRTDWMPIPVIRDGASLEERVAALKARTKDRDDRFRLEIDRLMRFEHRRRFRSKQRSIRASKYQRRPIC